MLYSTFSKTPYFEQLMAATASQLVQWGQRIINASTGVIVTNRANMFHRARIVVELRFLGKSGKVLDICQRRTSLYEETIPYKSLKYLHVRKLSSEHGWVALHRVFGRME